jgi:ABC-type multidrug transport system fused ATPase/permease subunit
MGMTTLTLGAALVAFSPIVALFSMIVYHKAQLVIVVTTAAFFFLLSSVIASMFWYTFHYGIGFNGPLAAIIPGVFFQFLLRCSFVSLYHGVEKVIEQSLEKQQQQEEEEERKKRQHLQQRNNGNTTATDTTTGSVRQPHRHPHNHNNGASSEEQEQAAADEEASAARSNTFTQAARLRLQLNDASCGVAAGVGYGAMHAILFYGTLLASQISNNVGVLYQDSCPQIPSIVVSAIYCCIFSVLDIFWMLFTFFGMRRRLIFHRGELSAAHDNRSTGGMLGNNRTGGNLALLFCLVSHFVTSVFTTADYFRGGCIVSLPCVGGIVLIVAYVFWAGCGRIYLPNEQKASVAAAATPRAASRFSYD